eukprot:2167953-Rhodomonas_salina.1
MQHKQAAKAILFDDEVVDCLSGEQLSGLEEDAEADGEECAAVAAEEELRAVVADTRHTAHR